jgi:methionyl-tRNA formyltransferase
VVYLFCAHREWALKLYEKINKKYEMILLDNPKKLTYNYIKKINPTYIFFPDWSWMIPDDIVNNFTCICFHESDLPKFRGGSPLQNQIIRGIKNSKTTAFIMNEKLDAGEILMKRKLSLSGTIEEIFSKMIENDYEIIIKIIQGEYKKYKQKGKATMYKRRNPAQSELKNLNHSKKYIFDFIRMLGDPYPNAFIKIGKNKIMFKSAKLKGTKLSFDGVIE